MLKAVLVASAVSLWGWAGTALAADRPSQLQRCQTTLAKVARQPLLTLEHYPGYLLERHLTPPPDEPNPQLEWCETTLWAQVSENLKLQPALVNAECSRSERIPNSYAGLRTYFMGIPNLRCEADWFSELSPAQWQQLQPMLADLNLLEYDCYQGLEALARDGQLWVGQARSFYHAVMLSRKVFDQRWGDRLVGLSEAPKQALQKRWDQLTQCERILERELDAK